MSGEAIFTTTGKPMRRAAAAASSALPATSSRVVSSPYCASRRFESGSESAPLAPGLPVIALFTGTAAALCGNGET